MSSGTAEQSSPHRLERTGFGALLAAILLQAACGSQGGTAPGATTPGAASPPPAPSITSLELTSAEEFPIFPGETAELRVTAVRSDNSRVPVDSALPVWTSSIVSVATVSAGVVTAVEPGNAEIRALYEGVSAEVPVPVRIPPTARGKVRVIYAAPADRPFRADYSAGISRTIAHARTWFRRQLGGLTFELHDTTPEFCQLPEDFDHYSQGDSWNRIIEGLQDCAEVRHLTPSISWYVFADVGELCGQDHELGAAVGGLAIVPRHDLELLVGSQRIETCAGRRRRSRLSVAGGFGHELGHTFGLPHPPGCDERRPHCDRDALMSFGVYEYPDTYLRPDEKEVLMRSRFFRRTGPRGASPQEFAIQGVVRDATGAPLQGIRVSVMSDHYWDWSETRFDGGFSIGVPDRRAGPFLVSVHAGDTADCNWLGYHGPGGLHSSRRDATLVEVADGAPESLEIELPLSPSELCNLDRTVSGIVLDHSGRPVEGARVYFDRFGFRTGQDGTWKHRLFEGWWAHHMFQPLRLFLPECDDLFFFSQDGFSSQVYWSEELERRFEVGPLGVTDIRIRLRASPAQVCRES